MDTPRQSATPVYELPDLTPEVYARWRASELGAITERLERRLVLAHIGEVSGRVILEIGCGDGHLAVKLVEMGANVSAIDASPAMVSAARELAGAHGTNINFMVGAARRPARACALCRAATAIR